MVCQSRKSVPFFFLNHRFELFVADPCGGVYCGAHGSCAYGCSGCSSTACQCPVSGQCTCYDGWSGRDCLTPPDPCIGVSCGVHGSCRSQGQTWYCQCLDGWSGSQCDVAPNPCVYFKVDCSLHGTCKSTSESTYTCTCDSGWTGSNCATQGVFVRIASYVLVSQRVWYSCDTRLHAGVCMCRSGRSASRFWTGIHLLSSSRSNQARQWLHVVGCGRDFCLRGDEQCYRHRTCLARGVRRPVTPTPICS